MTAESPLPRFDELGLSETLLAAVTALGYESPSPIQAHTIPVLLAGSDVFGQAQTGTGKTAAFALPVLERIDLKQTAPQALVLVPTRELAIQVAEAFQKYAANLKGFHVLPIYGGQSYTPQLKGLKRGPHVVVGTPGRVMDHMKSGAFDLATLRFLVLDEGDEMLQMGFVDDIEWILEQAPAERQVALFSATMPAAIRRIAQKHMRTPVEITIRDRANTAPNIRQRYWLVSGMHKLDALTRVLEVTRFDAMLIFVRTKLETAELADRLEARGFAAAALNGDMQQQQRERTVARLKAGQLDILVATDVAARGLDVERISHVVNYDIPYDAETYVHRIGRTGRAGRSGEAILFVAQRERNMLRIIERVTRQRIEEMTLPTVADVNEQRVLKFKERIAAAVQSDQGKVFQELIQQIEREQNIPASEIAAALAGLLQGSAPFLLAAKAEENRERRDGPWRADTESQRPERSARPERSDRPARNERTEQSTRHERNDRSERSDRTHRGTRTAHGERDERPAQAARIEDKAPVDAASEPPARFERERAEQPERVFADERPRSDGDRDEGSAERRPRRSREDGPPMESFRIEVGHVHGVQPGNIVGAIANEAGLDGRHIGHIDIREDHSFIDLPEGMPKEIFRELKKVRVRGTELQISRVDSKPPREDRPPRSAHRPHAAKGMHASKGSHPARGAGHAHKRSDSFKGHRKSAGGRDRA